MRAAAAAFGKMSGKIGGPAHAARLSPRKRSEIANKAAADEMAIKKVTSMLREI